MTGCDFLVLGAGVAGASAAYELGAHGRVILLEREDAPGYHATGRSAAQYVETYGPETIRRLAKASRPFFEQPPDGFAAQPLLNPRGALCIARDDQLAQLSDRLAEVQALTPAVTRIDPAEAIRMVPVLRPDHVAAAFLEPDSMDIDVGALHQGYLTGLRRRGGELVTDAEVVGLSHRDGAWRAETRAGAFAAPVVVNAAGAWCDEVAAMAGLRPVGLVPKRRTVITFDAPAGIVPKPWPMVIDVAEAFYFKPEAGRILASPGDQTPVPPCDAQPEELDVATVVHRLEQATTLRIPRIAHKWAGLRSFVADNSLVIGLDDLADGFFWLAGQGGYGIETAPAAARATAGLLAHGRLPTDLAGLGLEPAALAPDRLDRGGRSGAA